VLEAIKPQLRRNPPAFKRLPAPAREQKLVVVRACGLDRFADLARTQRT
jgi:hypothetical protein